MSFEEPSRDFYRDVDMRKLPVDTCVVDVWNPTTDNIYLYTLNSNCYECPYQRKLTVMKA